MKFYLGTHMPYWLWKNFDKNIPLFISRRTLCKIKNVYKTNTTWALDSGGFSELSLFGKWTIEENQYVEEILNWNENIGNLDFACIQDYMCEPFIIQKTGLSIKEHQKKTIQSYLNLSNKIKNIYILPILQGWEIQDYLQHIKMYETEGIILENYPLVGIGSVCRRQHTNEIANIIKILYLMGLNLHGFGIKTMGLQKIKKYIRSSDSMAWSFGARYDKPLDGCTHKNCANCAKYAKKWYYNLLKKEN